MTLIILITMYTYFSSYSGIQLLLFYLFILLLSFVGNGAGLNIDRVRVFTCVIDICDIFHRAAR